MTDNYYKIGDYISVIDNRNTDGSITKLMGISIDKCYIPSVANVIGTDLSNYKVIQRGQFACSLMQVSRDQRIPIAMYEDDDPAIMSPAYVMFEVSHPDELLPEYMELWFKRAEFDREASFYAVGGVRGSLDWEDFCKMELPVPPLSEQRKIVRDYQVITDRIELLRKENDTLIELVKTLYANCFSEGDYPHIPMSQICSKIGSGATPRGGKDSYCEEGISLIRSTNVYDYSFSYNDLAHINEDQAKALSNVIVEPYDVLFNITGVSIARCCMVPPNVLPARVNQHVMILRPIAGKYMSYYLLMTMCEQSNKNLLLGIGQSGSTREAINKQEMEDFKISLPSKEEISAFGEQAEICFGQIQCVTQEMEILQSMQKLMLAQIHEVM